MKISTKGEYGLRAMLYLAMHGAEDPITSREVAARQSIPEPYLRQILALLARSGLVRSNRGPQGGHLLARDAAEITLRDILLVLEGRTTSVDLILGLECSIEVGVEHCAIREVLLKVRAAVDRLLAGTTLADLRDRQVEIVERGIEVPRALPADETDALPVLE